MQRTVPAMPAAHGCCKDRLYALHDAARRPRPDPVRKDRSVPEAGEKLRTRGGGGGGGGLNVSAA